MDLSALFAALPPKTGRYDLAQADWLNLINQACRLLDRLEDSQLRTARLFFNANAGVYSVAMPASVRAAKAVLMHTTDGTKHLTLATPAKVREAIAAESAETYYYALDSAPIYTSALNVSPDDVENQTELAKLTDRPLYLIFSPTHSSNFTIEVYAIAYSLQVDDDNTSNFWTLRYEELVIQAVNYLLIKDLLDIDSSTKILEDLQEWVRDVSFDLIEQEDIGIMEG